MPVLQKNTYLLAAGVVGGLAVLYYLIKDRGELIDVDSMTDLDRRLMEELKKEVSLTSDTIDISTMLSILKVVRTHEKYVHQAKLVELIDERRNAQASKNFGVWQEI